MPTTATYQVKDDNGRTLREVPGVLAEVRQTGCEVTNDSQVMLVEDSTVLYPGMQVCCQDVAEGTYILAIKDGTHVILSAAATNSVSNLVGIFKGMNWVAISKTADRGWWRNLISNGGANVLPLRANFGAGGSGLAEGAIGDTAISVVPAFSVTAGTDNQDPRGTIVLTGLDVVKDDTLASSPTLRTKTEHWSFWSFVSTGGHVSVVPFDPEHSVCLKELVTVA